MKKTISFVTALLILVIMSSQVSATGDAAMNWYCARNKEHKQPALDANMSFIEKYGGYYVDKKVAENDKVVYLTFDAGYENGNIEKILDTMKSENVTGAFFILSNLIDRNPQLVMRMAEEGHIVANHTSSHKDMTTVDSIEEFASELDVLSDSYRTLTGREMAKYYRPPEGRFDERGLDFACRLGYKTIFWSFAYADWDNGKQPTEEYAKKKIFDNIHNGAVILLHPTSETNAKILGDVIKQLKAEGYRFGTLDELTSK